MKNTVARHQTAGVPVDDFEGPRARYGNSVSLWKATDLTPLGSVATGNNSGPRGACSDGINFWITLATTDRLARL